MVGVRLITERMLERLKPGEELREASGLVARRRAKAVSFMVLMNGRKVTLGRWPALGPAAARALLVRPVSVGNETMGDLLDAYEANLRRRRRKDPVQIDLIIAKYIRPALGSRRLLGIGRRDLQRIVDDATTDNMGRRIATVLRAAWRFGVKRGMLEHDVTLDMPKAGAPRQRVLTDDEIALLLNDWLTINSQFGPLFALLLLTGCRRSEIAELRRTEVRGDKLVLPAERTKTAVSHVVPLSTFAREVLASVPALDEDKVFPAHWESATKPRLSTGRPGRGFISGFAGAVAKSSKRTGVMGWTVHDLRRTCATGLARLGTPPHVIEAVLNHTPPRIVRTYQVTSFEAEKAEALQRWADHVREKQRSRAAAKSATQRRIPRG